MAHDVAVIGATIAGLTAARRLAAEGFDVVVLDPNPEGASAAIGHGVAACAHASTVATMSAAYGAEAARDHVRRNLAGMEEVHRVIATGGVEHSTLMLHDHSVGAALDRELRPVAELLTSAGAEVRVLTQSERRQAAAGLISEATVVDPVRYAAALRAQASHAGARIHHDVTVTHLQRRDGVSVLLYRDNLVWARQMSATQALAVIDTLGVSPWGRIAGAGSSQCVPRVRFSTHEVPEVVTLTAGPPVWMTRADGGDVLAFGPKCTPAALDQAMTDLSAWVEGTGGEVLDTGSLTIDPSDHGRPVVGASAIPGGFYTRGNGRGELMNGTASGSYLASVLLGFDPSAAEIALPLSSRIRAHARGLRNKLLSR